MLQLLPNRFNAFTLLKNTWLIGLIRIQQSLYLVITQLITHSIQQFTGVLLMLVYRQTKAQAKFGSSVDLVLFVGMFCPL